MKVTTILSNALSYTTSKIFSRDNYLNAVVKSKLLLIRLNYYFGQFECVIKPSTQPILCYCSFSITRCFLMFSGGYRKSNVMRWVNPFHANVLFLYPLKTSENRDPTFIKPGISLFWEVFSLYKVHLWYFFKNAEKHSTKSVIKAEVKLMSCWAIFS